MTRLDHSPFFRAPCGCIGLQIGPTTDKVDGKNIYCLIEPCDLDHDERSPLLHVCHRGFDVDKEYTPLSEEETLKLLDTLNGLVHKGHAYHEIRSLLGMKYEDA